MLGIGSQVHQILPNWSGSELGQRRHVTVATALSASPVVRGSVTVYRLVAYEFYEDCCSNHILKTVFETQKNSS